MVAPIDAVSIIEAGDESYKLRLNFRTIELADDISVDLYDPRSLNRLTTRKTAQLVRCLATPDQPDFTDEMGFALVVGHAEAVTMAIFEVIKLSAGKGGESANPPKAGRAKQTA